MKFKDSFGNQLKSFENFREITGTHWKSIDILRQFIGKQKDSFGNYWKSCEIRLKFIGKHLQATEILRNS